jgi:hypothetical protein
MNDGFDGRARDKSSVDDGDDDVLGPSGGGWRTGLLGFSFFFFLCSDRESFSCRTLLAESAPNEPHFLTRNKKSPSHLVAFSSGQQYADSRKRNRDLIVHL